MTPLLTAQTRANVLTFCASEGIKHGLIFSDDPLDNEDRSRVKALDPDGLLLGYIVANFPEDWSRDSGGLHNVHGIKVRASYRSRTTPSLQVCVIEARGGQYEYVLDIDLDEYSPFENFIGHSVEVLANKFSRKTTDPYKIARMLERLRPGGDSRARQTLPAPVPDHQREDKEA